MIWLIGLNFFSADTKSGKLKVIVIGWVWSDIDSVLGYGTLKSDISQELLIKWADFYYVATDAIIFG